MNCRDRTVILVGDGEAAAAKRRLLERAGARVIGEEEDAALAIVALDDPEPTVARLRARNILINAVDRPDLCDFTLPSILDRDPVLIAIGTGGASAGLAKALRQRLESILPSGLGQLAEALHGARTIIRARWPAPADRRRAIDRALASGGALDPLRDQADDAVTSWLKTDAPPGGEAAHRIELRTPDPDDLTLREARLLGSADRIYHRPDVPTAILDRARADAVRIACAAAPHTLADGLSIDLGWEGR